MMLAAHALGLGSCWVGFGAMVTADPGVRALLGLQEGGEIFGPLLVGYPQNVPPRPPKKEPTVKWI
jgi:nitroreductase